ncbi:MAG: hypothetical protein ABII27_01285 [bacterium]
MSRNWQAAALLIVFALISIWVGKFITATSSMFIPLALAGLLFLTFTTFVRPHIAIVILVLSMMLSPEIPIAQLSRKELVIRIDDFLIILVFISWLVKIAINKEIGLTIKTPLNKLLIAYSVVAAISTTLGIYRGDINAASSFFFVLKYFEYYMLFFLVLNNVNDKRLLKLYLYAGVFTCVIVTLYAYSQIGSVDRLTAPFEAPIGKEEGMTYAEPGTLGGYYLLVFGLIFGFLSEYSGKITLFFWGLIIFIINPFFLTLSRASYIGLGILILSFMFLARSKRVLLIGACLAGALFYSVFSITTKQAVTERIAYTVKGADYVYGTRKINVFGKEILLEPSTAMRLGNYEWIIKDFFPKRPFLGYGATGVGLVDAQYPRILGEMGIIGLAIFFAIVITIFKQSWKIYKQIDHPLSKSLSLGLIFILIGIMFQALGANTFIIVRIMEPFWFLTAVVFSLPKLYDIEIDPVRDQGVVKPVIQKMA